MLFNWFVSFFLVVIVGLSSMTMWTMIWASNYIFPGFKVQINAILVVNFIISIGFCVEFCIHSIIRYKRAKGSHIRKMDSMITDIVSVVFKGIFLTKFIGLSVLCFSPIKLFVLYYFRVYYIMIFTCGFYGLIVTPILLDLLGQRMISKSDDKKKSLNDYIRERNHKDSEGVERLTKNENFVERKSMKAIPEEKADEDSFVV